MQRHLVARYVSYTRVAHCALRDAQLLEIFQAVLQLAHTRPGTSGTIRIRSTGSTLKCEKAAQCSSILSKNSTYVLR